MNMITYSDKGKKMGCAQIFFLLFGLMVAGGSLFFLVIMYVVDEKESASYLYYGIPPLSIGLLAIFTAIRNFRFSYRYTVELNKSSKKLIFFKESKDQKLEIPFSEFSKILLVKSHVSGAGSMSSTQHMHYQIYIQLIDGAWFWLYSTTRKEVFIEEVNRLKTFLNLPVEDQSGCSLDSDGETYDGGQRKRVLEPSRFVKIESNQIGKTISISKPGYFIDEVIKLLLLVFLGSLVNIMVNALAYSPLVVQLMMFVVFGAFLLIMIGFVFILGSKKYYVTVNREGLILQLHFPYKWIDKKLGRTITIPKSEIMQIRTSRLHEGHFWLSCITSSTVSLKDSVLFGMGAFSGRKLMSTMNKENVLGLWEVPNYAKHRDTANFMDLYYIEQWLQDQLQLQESTIDA